MGFRKDMTGERIGKLVVVEFDYDKNMWKYKMEEGEAVWQQKFHPIMEELCLGLVGV